LADTLRPPGPLAAVTSIFSLTILYVSYTSAVTFSNKRKSLSISSFFAVVVKRMADKGKKAILAGGKAIATTANTVNKSRKAAIDNFFLPKAGKKQKVESKEEEEEEKNEEKKAPAAVLVKQSSNANLDKEDTVDPTEALWKDLTDDAWIKALARVKQSSAPLSKFVQAERSKHKIFPPISEVWSALNATSLKDVKVVIVGQV
jgi:hypothetical protein